MALAFLCFGNTLRNGYNMDDELVTMGHRLTSHGLSAIPDIFTSPYYADEQGYSYEYRPITLVTFAIEHALFGESPFVGHLINVILFGLTVILVFLLTKRLFPHRGMILPLFAALLFLAHPMHSEAVASIKNREELLSLLGGLLSLLAAVRLVRSRNWLWLIAMASTLLLGMMSKLSVLSFVAVLPIIVLMIGGTIAQHAVTACAMATVLAAVLWLRTGIGLQELALSTAGFLALQAAAVPIVRPMDLMQKLRSNLVRTFSEEDGTIAKTGSTWHAMLTGTLCMGLIGAGVLSRHEPPVLAAIGLLFVHPLLLGGWNRWLLGIGIIGLAALERSDEMMPFYPVALSILFLFGSKTWMRRTDDLFLIMGTIGGVIAISVMGGSDSGGILSKLLFISLVFLAAHRGLLSRHRWLRAVIVLFFAFSAILAFIRGAKLEVGLLFLGVAAYEFVIRQTSARRMTGAVLLLVALISVSLPQTLPKQSDSEIVSESSTVSVEVPAEFTAPRPALDLFLGNDIDRPLSYAEYPHGFDANVSTRVGTASAIMGHYLKMMLIPWPQSFYYGFDEVPVTDMKNPWAILSVTVHLLLLILAVILARGHHILSFGIIAYLASIFLFSNLVSPVAGMIADRLTYVASFGFCLALGYVFHLLFERFNAGIGRKVVTAAFALLLVGWGGMTIARNAQWKDALTLMRHDIKHVPNSAQAHNLLASHLMKNSFEPEYASEAMNMRLEAIGHFKQSARIWPEFFNVWYDIGRAYMTINQPDNALPAYKEAHRLDSTFYDATINIAMISEQRGNIPQAIDYYERCIRINPEMQEPYGNLSYLLFREGSFAESAAVNELAIIQHPAWKDPYLNLSRTYQAMGDMDRANEFALKAQQMP
jgi:tetratricopeptide (TPR) repeat protein